MTFGTSMTRNHTSSRRMRTFGHEQIKSSTINYNAMNIMQCMIHPTKYSHVSMCTIIKEMWDKFKLIYKETNQVKEKVNVLMHDYELFRMKLEETIFEIFNRLTKIINGLK